MGEECLIVGAGPTGLALAIELTRFGIPVRLIDKSDHAAQWSQALVVQARTLEQFDRYGIAEQAVAAGRKIQHARFFSDRKEIASVDLARIPSRFNYVLFLPQSETEKLLTDHLRSLGIEIERGTELPGFENNGDGGVNVSLHHADGRTEQNRYRWLIGCDGAHSKVRQGMGVSFEGDTVGLHFSLGDVHLTGKDVPDDDLFINLHRGGDVLFVAKLKDEVYRVIVALHDQQRGEQKAPEIDDFNAAFVRFGVDIKADSAEWLAPFRVNQRKAGKYRVGNVFLAGDASHIHSPVGGQGMNTGIQDAANLAWKIAAVRNGADDNLLDSYDEERGQVGDALLRGTSRGLRAATASNLAVEKIRDFVLHAVVKMEAVQDAIADNISETSIEYRDSSIVSDHAHGGPLKAGDRLPDTSNSASGETLLQDLRSPNHLLIAIDIPVEEVPRDLPHTRVVELKSGAEGWTPTITEVLGKGPLVYLVRPDGYIGFRGVNAGDAFKKYAGSVGIN